MSIICPTVLAETPDDFKAQMDRVAEFAERIQIDLMDGDFAPSKSINPIQVWWPNGLTVDIHLMFRDPIAHLETLVSLNPNMVILHAEADGDIFGAMQHIKQFGIKAGVCLLKETTVKHAEQLIRAADHVLLFSGDLGHFGGTADMNVLKKVKDIRELRPDIEIGWDGGANLNNVAELARGGIDVINVGGAIQKASDPAYAYATLTENI